MSKIRIAWLIFDLCCSPLMWTAPASLNAKVYSTSWNVDTFMGHLLVVTHCKVSFNLPVLRYGRRKCFVQGMLLFHSCPVETAKCSRRMLRLCLEAQSVFGWVSFCALKHYRHVVHCIVVFCLHLEVYVQIGQNSCLAIIFHGNPKRYKLFTHQTAFTQMSFRETTKYETLVSDNRSTLIQVLSRLLEGVRFYEKILNIEINISFSCP